MEEDTDVATYEELAQLEREFDSVDDQLIAHTYQLTQPLYTKRASTVSKIPHFWPLVFEQCPEEIDQYIQPSDSEILALHLKDFSVTRPDIPSPSPNGGANGSDANAAKAPKPGAHGNGSPRTVRFTFTFSPNPWFHDTTLTKTFTHRRTLSGASHYTSVPVRINWKSEEGKEDLTAGAGSMACALQDAIDAMVTSAPAGEDAGGKEKRLDLSGVKSRARTLQKKIQELKEYKALAAKVEASSEGSQSFFAWFGYRGRYVSEEEARIGEEAWSAILNGEDLDRVEEEGEEDVEDLLEGGLLEEEADDEAEIFPAGEELATVLADDLWVNALKYFTQAQESDDIDSQGFSSEEAASDDEGDVPDIRSLVKDSQMNGAGPPAKRQKV